jgi:hypothetical protein
MLMSSDAEKSERSANAEIDLVEAATALIHALTFLTNMLSAYVNWSINRSVPPRR